MRTKSSSASGVIGNKPIFTQVVSVWRTSELRQVSIRRRIIYVDSKHFIFYLHVLDLYTCMYMHVATCIPSDSCLAYMRGACLHITGSTTTNNAQKTEAC